MSTMSAVSHPAAGEKHLIANRPQQQALHGFRRKKAGGGLADLGVKVGAYVIKPHFDADAIGLYISGKRGNCHDLMIHAFCMCVC